MLTDARPNWFKLGFQLDIKLNELTIIEMNRKDVDACYIEMLSTWLKTINPQPSWDGLLTALEHESVKCENLADNIRKKYGIPKHTPTATSAAKTLLQETEPGAARPSETSACQLMHHFHAFIIISIVTSAHDIRGITDELESRFGDLADHTFDCLKDNGVKIEKIKSRLANLPVRSRQLHEEFLMELWHKMKDPTLDDVWVELGRYWDFLNYSLLEYLIKKFGDKELAERMEEYKRRLREFRCCTRLCDFAQHFKDVNKTLVDKNVTKSLEVKLSKNWEECTLEDLEMWKENITQKLLLPSFVVILRDMDSGCISITWTIPALYASSLMEDVKKMDLRGFCEEQEIMWMSIDGVECWHSDLTPQPCAGQS